MPRRPTTRWRIRSAVRSTTPDSACRLHCAHSRLFVLVPVQDPDAESDEEMDEDSEETESTAPGAGTAKPGEVLTPLISCLSLRCLSFLPGCVRELEMIQFYDDAELAGVAKLYDPDGKIEALPSFHAEYELKKNPRKRVGNSSGQPSAPPPRPAPEPARYTTAPLRQR